MMSIFNMINRVSIKPLYEGRLSPESREYYDGRFWRTKTFYVLPDEVVSCVLAANDDGTTQCVVAIDNPNYDPSSYSYESFWKNIVLAVGKFGTSQPIYLEGAAYTNRNYYTPRTFTASLPVSKETGRNGYFYTLGQAAISEGSASVGTITSYSDAYLRAYEIKFS